MACKVHRVRYYSPNPQPVNCASFNKTSKQLAIARGDASIEIWDMNYAPYLTKFIPGVENGSVEALCWVQDRLLSTGLGGALVEWDLEKLSLKNTILLTGFAAWCLDVTPDNSLVAVGTEQGYINVFSVENEDIVYKKLFDKQEGRILCCKFDETGNTLVTGSVNTIRVWNVESGHATTRISVSRRGMEVIVWCLAVLSDNVVVSGDSLGRLTFWDSKMGDQIESYTTQKADILALAVSDDEKKIYFSGVDPVIMNFVKVNQNIRKETSANQWVKHVQLNIHEHDVRALLVNEEQLISLGVDGYLTLSSYPPKWVMRIPYMIPVSRSSVSAQKKLLLLRFSNHFEVWKLGSYAVNDSGNVVNINNGQDINDSSYEANGDLEHEKTMENVQENGRKQNLQLVEKPFKLVSVQTKGKKQMRCCELSPSGDVIVYTTDNSIRMLKLEMDDEEQSSVSVSKLPVRGVPAACDRVSFSPDAGTLVAHAAGALHVAHVDRDAGAALTHTIHTDKYFQSKCIVQLVVSAGADGATVLAAGAACGGAAVWARAERARKFELRAALPRYRCPPAAMAVDAERNLLIVTYVDLKVVEFDLSEKKLASWSLPEACAARRSAPRALRPHPARRALLLHDEASVWLVDPQNNNIEEDSPTNKKSKTEQPSTSAKIIPMKYLADFHWLGKDEAVSVEVTPENIVSQLPAMSRKRLYC